MAKLSARGRHELASFERERVFPTTDNFSVVWERITYRLMSDKHILMKRDVKWADGRKHNWGWKDGGRYTSQAEIEAKLEKLKYSKVA